VNDAELAAYLCIEESQIATLVKPGQRETYEALASLEDKIKRFQAGDGPLPREALLCWDHRCKP
jgi:hypothetical protein